MARKKAEKEKKPFQKSPYTLFREWLNNSMLNSKLPEDVLKAINPRSVLCMFGKMGDITIALNEHCNDYALMQCDPQEFYMFLKEVVQRNNIGQYDFSFFSTAKTNKSLKELSAQLPFLKPYEISKLIKYTEDKEEFEDFREELGLITYKKSKLTKAEQKKREKTNKDIPTIEREEEYTGNIETWDQWLATFGESN